MFRWVSLLLLGLTGLGFCHGASKNIFNERTLEGVENLRRKVQTKQFLDPRGRGPKGSYQGGTRVLEEMSSSKGDKKISKNGSKKKNGEDYEFFFMIQVDEYADSTDNSTMSDLTIGTKFAFTAKIAIDDDWDADLEEDLQLGSAVTSCVLCLEDITNTTFTQYCCDMFLTFNQNGEDFYDFATVALSGWFIPELEAGYFMVGGSGGDWVMSHKGELLMQLDPWGNPVFYAELNLHD